MDRITSFLSHFSRYLKTLLVLLMAMALLASCDDSSVSVADGTEGGACYPNGTCNDGLDCINNKCVDQTNNNNVTPGDLGGPCLAGDLCNGTLVCVEDVCVEDEPGPGDLGGPCLAGDLCNGELLCYEDVCHTDADGDGIPAELDCDDTDENVVLETVRVCTSACDEGTQMCLTDGTWSTCSAETTCECNEPGAIREHECGNCGWGYQHCGSDYQWGMVDECLDQGECRPGEEGDQECGFCGSQTRMCDTQCNWLDWSECANPGECIPGTISGTTDDCTPLGAIRHIACSDACVWEDSGECFTDCEGIAREGTVDASGFYDYKDEICISAGPFYMGTDSDEYYIRPKHRPMHIVYLSPYFIDKYEVTRRRYRECIEAGACVAVGDFDFFDDDYHNFPAIVDYHSAVTFCEWDGGRVLPTEAEWMKAARGPYPRTVMHPWGDDLAVCTDWSMPDCLSNSGMQSVEFWADRDESYYGAIQMGYGVAEITADRYVEDYHLTCEELNPYFENDDSMFTLRGKHFGHASSTEYSILSRVGVSTTFSTAIGFRCAKVVY